jgi:Flp pilus assembly protein TadB
MMIYILSSIIILLLAYIFSLHREAKGYKKRIAKVIEEGCEDRKYIKQLENSNSNYHDVISELRRKYSDLLTLHNSLKAFIDDKKPEN